MGPPKLNGLNVEISELKDELRELRADFKHWLETSNNTQQDVAKLLARHEERLENLKACAEKQDARHEGLVLKLWGLAAATLLAMVTAVISFLFKN